MPQGGFKEYRTFVKGIITEASPLTFPEDSSKDEDNFELYRDGSRQRRLGIDYESLYTLVDTGLDDTYMNDASVTEYRWDNVNSDPTVSIGVIQVYNKLWFVDLYKTAVSSNLLNGGSALTISGVANEPIEFSSVNGVLVGVNKNIHPFKLEYDKVSDTVTKTSIILETRDFWGIDDNLLVDERPETLSNEHAYNLYNQGWLTENIDSVFSSKSEYPSNSDIQHLAKDSNDVFQVDGLYKQYFGNTPAPKGKYIIDIFDRGYSRAAVLENPPEGGVASPVSGRPSGEEEIVEPEERPPIEATISQEAELGRPTTVAAYGQRIFYAGIESNILYADDRSPNFTGTIFFSKVVSSNSDLGVCYQEADPTSEHVSDIIDSDGGFINIPEANNIIKLETTESSLVVIAENGVWEIYGDTGGFTATTYQVSKVTNVGAVNSASVVNAEGKIFYWSKGGIYLLSVDKVSARLSAANITETTIQTLFNNISGVAKANAKGIFDPSSRKVTWMYNDDTDYDGITYRYKANRELILNTVLQAFHTRTIQELDTDSPYIVGYLSTPNFLSSDYSQEVVVNGVPVQANGVDVVVTESFRSRGISSTKYLTIKPSSTGNYKFTFAEYNNEDFLDWYSDNNVGKDAAAYLDTGQELFDDTLRNKQVPYILFHFKRTETGFEIVDGNLVAKTPSSCLVQARWDFANHTNSGKYGTQFQAYRLRRNYIPTGTDDTFDYGQEVITTKSKLRGKGKALSLHIESEPGKDMYLLGWGLNVVMGNVV